MEELSRECGVNFLETIDETRCILCLCVCRPPPIIRRITSYPRTRAAEFERTVFGNGIRISRSPSRSPSRSRPAASAIVRATTVACRTCHAVPPKQRIGPRRTLQRLHAEHVTQCLPNNELDHGVRYNGCMPNMSRSASQTTNWTTAYGPNLSHWAEKPWAAPRVEITTRLRAIRGNRKRQSGGN